MNLDAAVQVDDRIRWSAIGLLLAVPAAAWVVRGLAIPPHEVLGLAALAIPLAGAARFCARTGRIAGERFFLGVLQFVLFTCGLTAVSCLAAAAGRPLIDARLVTCDAWLHRYLPDVTAWAAPHPALRTLLTLAYDTVVPQTLLTIFLLARWREDRRLDWFMRQLMAAALASLVIFALFPAEGPCANYPYELSPALRHYLAAFHELRTAPRPAIHFFVFEGLITFPSFHAAWAVVLTAAYARRPVLLGLLAVWNAAVVVSTMTAGGHYLIDVLVGLALGGAAVVALGPLPGRWAASFSEARQQR